MSAKKQPVSPGAKPHVIIVGAGIGGLTLALLLERAGVPYVALEKTSSIKPLGNEKRPSTTIQKALVMREDHSTELPSLIFLIFFQVLHSLLADK